MRNARSRPVVRVVGVTFPAEGATTPTTTARACVTALMHRSEDAYCRRAGVWQTKRAVVTVPAFEAGAGLLHAFTQRRAVGILTTCEATLDEAHQNEGHCGEV